MNFIIFDLAQFLFDLLNGDLIKFLNFTEPVDIILQICLYLRIYLTDQRNDLIPEKIAGIFYRLIRRIFNELQFIFFCKLDQFFFPERKQWSSDRLMRKRNS